MAGTKLIILLVILGSFAFAQSVLFTGQTLPKTPYFDRISKFAYWINIFREQSAADFKVYHDYQKSKRQDNTEFTCFDDLVSLN